MQDVGPCKILSLIFLNRILIAIFVYNHFLDMKNNSNLRVLVLTLFVIFIVAIRAVAPKLSSFDFLANFTAFGAVSIFCGAYFKNTFTRFFVPLAVLFLSDVALATTMGIDYGFYSGWQFTYLAFALIVLVGHILVKKVNVANVFAATLVSVLIHWIVTDFGVWLGSQMYPQTVAGFWACLVAAIPFELNFIYGTLLYSAIMFVGFEALKTKYPALRTYSLSA